MKFAGRLSVIVLILTVVDDKRLARSRCQRRAFVRDHGRKGISAEAQAPRSHADLLGGEPHLFTTSLK
jgi:hypothetical protein